MYIVAHYFLLLNNSLKCEANSFNIQPNYTLQNVTREWCITSSSDWYFSDSQLIHDYTRMLTIDAFVAPPN